MKNLLASLAIVSVLAAGNAVASDQANLLNSQEQLVQTGTSIGFNWPLGLSSVNETVSVDYTDVMDGFNWPEGY